MLKKPLERRGSPCGRLYDWVRWFALDAFELHRGVDYNCSQSTMAQNVRSAAAKMRKGEKCSVTDLGTGLLVEFKERGNAG